MNKETFAQNNASINEFKFISKPLTILFILVVLFSILFSVGVNKINNLRLQIVETNQLSSVLSKKINVLESIPSVLTGDTTFLDVALPSRGAVLFGISQVKSQSISNNVIVSNLKTGSSVPVKNDISKISISFDVAGTEESVYNFLKSFSTSLPLMSVDRVRLNKSDAGLSASSTIFIYTAELPTKILAVSSGTAELTQADINTITEISTYQIPQFIEPKPTDIEAKVDPFN
jgi:hypothetical protein